jgi:hypothetical protein
MILRNQIEIYLNLRILIKIKFIYKNIKKYYVKRSFLNWLPKYLNLNYKNKKVIIQKKKKKNFKNLKLNLINL